MLNQPDLRTPRIKSIAAVCLAALVGVIGMLVIPARAVGPWHDGDRPHRFDVTIDPDGITRSDLSVATPVDFTAALLAGGNGGSAFDLASILVVEVDGTGTIVPGGGSVPYQFDPAASFDATTDATGDLVILLTGTTSAMRNYQVYFRDLAVAGSYTPVDHSGTVRVTVAEGQTDEGRAVTLVSNFTASWFYDNEGGGFTSIVDGSGADWISWSNTVGSGGTFRGLPNLEHPTNEFHPGFDHVSTVVDSTGPLRVAMTSTSDDGEWTMRWFFYKRHVVAEVVDSPNAETYWFQYEGTPGGSLGPEDKIIRNDATTTDSDVAWIDELDDPEWAAAADTTLGRSLYLAQLGTDTTNDSYSPLGGVMTVLSFGRTALGLTQHLSGPSRFAVGLVGGSTHSGIGPSIERDITDLVITVGQGESVATTTTTTTTMTPTTTAPTTSTTAQPTTTSTTAALTPATNTGYWILTSAGRMLAYGSAPELGNAPGSQNDVVASARTPSGAGYWMVRSTGEVIAFGDAVDHGDILDLGLTLAFPIVGMAPTATGNGYWLLGEDGGIFSFGDAGFFGSTGDLDLAAPVIDMAPTASGQGYYLVALDGGIFTFGDAQFLGSTGNLVLDRPVVSLTLGESGYWLVALDGGIFAFGEPFIGSIPGVLSHLSPSERPEGRRIRATPSGSGYLIVTADGGMFAFGTATYFGSAAGGLTPGEKAVDLMLLP